jgi:hypothetical protein
MSIAFAILLGGATFTFAQTAQNNHSQTMDHGTHMKADSVAVSPLTEPGQGAFASLSEIVSVLEADPETDWSQVNLGALRDHLVDMDRLVTYTTVKELELTNGVRAVASADADTIATLRRMVPAHAAELAKDDRWDVEVKEGAESLELTATSADSGAILRIKSLGYFGLMASQDHHKEHHVMMARGGNAHRN